MIVSWLYGYDRRFLHVRLHRPGREHPSPRHFESIEAEKAENCKLTKSPS